MTYTETQRDLRRDHRVRLDAARLLVDLEEAAFHADLPVLDWHVTVAGLVGAPPASAIPADREAAFDAWVEHLGVEAHEPGERLFPTRTRVLSAGGRVPHPQASTGTARVTLTAEINLDEEEEMA
jgi:hypothetical protein